MVSSLVSLFADTSCNDINFFGLLPWYHYLTVQPDVNRVCQVTNFTFLGPNSSILLVLLAVVDDMLRIAGLLAVLFVIYAGVKFILSQGDPAEAAKARGTAINALIGLAIAIVSISFVAYLGYAVGQGQGAQGTSGHLDLHSLPNPTGVDNGNIIQTALSIVFGVIGALSFMIIVIAGFRYMLAQGDPSATAQAKNTIIYALVGLVIAIAAQSIVSLVVSR